MTEIETHDELNAEEAAIALIVEITTRTALAIGHKARLLERVSEAAEHILIIPCPKPRCTTMLRFNLLDAEGLECCTRHRWTSAHSDCVRELASAYLGWFRDQASVPLPF